MLLFAGYFSPLVICTLITLLGLVTARVLEGSLFQAQIKFRSLLPAKLLVAEERPVVSFAARLGRNVTAVKRQPTQMEGNSRKELFPERGMFTFICSIYFNTRPLMQKYED